MTAPAIKPGRDAFGRFAKGNDQRLEKNGNWKGDAASRSAARDRLKRRVPVSGPCETCGEPAMDRHHKDGSTHNNDPSNIAMLCRRCHMEADGRLGVVRQNWGKPRQYHQRPKAGAR